MKPHEVRDLPTACYNPDGDKSHPPIGHLIMNQACSRCTHAAMAHAQDPETHTVSCGLCETNVYVVTMIERLG